MGRAWKKKIIAMSYGNYPWRMSKVMVMSEWRRVELQGGWWRRGFRGPGAQDAG